MSEPLLDEVLAALARAGLEQAEVYWKRGKTRRVELGDHDGAAVTTQEEGWAARAGDRRGWFFAAATGAPRPDWRWPTPCGQPLRLYEPPGTEPPAPPAGADAPLLNESEARGLLESIAQALAVELPGARLRRAVLEEGASESRLRSTRGVDAAWSGRAAALRLEAVGDGEGGSGVAVELAERHAAALRPALVARRLADRLLVARTGAPPERDRGEFLLAPPLAAKLLAALLPLFLGPQAPLRVAPLRDRRGRIGSPVLTLIDDGAHPGGVLAAAVDGEGVPTREIVMMEGGSFRQPLLTWREAQPPQTLAAGCSRRASWKDLPSRGPTHFFARPEPRNAVAALLGGVARGYYLLDSTGAPRVALEEDRFSVPVCGFAVQSGRATAPVAGAALVGAVSGLLRGVQAVGRDLAFLPLDGMIGSPTLFVTGLEIRREGG